MEIIRGKTTSFMDAATAAAALTDARTRYSAVHLDIGTGDGVYVAHVAHKQPQTFVIGLDACRDNLHNVSRRAPANTLFVIANALNLPCMPELHGTATHITLNFPWGSLLNGLLTKGTGLAAGLRYIARADACLEVRLNGGALTEAGWSLEDGSSRVCEILQEHGFMLRSLCWMSAQDLRSCPTTWAKRLAFGRDPRAVYLAAG